MKRASPVRVMQVAVAVIVACANCGSRTALLAPEKSEPEPVICRSAYVALTSLSAAEGPPSLDSVAVDGTDAYVAYSAAAGLSVQHLDAEGTPIGTPQPMLAGVGYGPGYVAAGYGHRAFMANGGGFMGGPVGCWFVALGADAAPSGSPVLFDPGPCSWLVATPTGFVAIESLHGDGPGDLISLDPSGNVLGRATVGPTGVVTSVASFDDGTVFVAWGNGLPSVIGQHLSANGDVLSAPQQIFQTSDTVSGTEFFAMASYGTGLFAAWGDTIHLLEIERVSPGGLSGTSSSLPTDIFRGLDVGIHGTGALVAWSLATASLPVTGDLVVQAVTGDGVPQGPRTFVAPGLQTSWQRLLETPSASLVAFTAAKQGAPPQLYVSRICGL